MTTIKERINAHLPIVLQLVSTLSLVVLALSAICGSQSLKGIEGAHSMGESIESHKGQKH